MICAIAEVGFFLVGNVLPTHPALLWFLKLIFSLEVFKQIHSPPWSQRSGRGCDGFVWAYRPQWWECSSTEGSGAGFLGSVEKNLFVFSAMWLGEGVFQSEVRFMLGFREMGCTVLEVLVVPGDDSISVFHCRQVWTSAKPWLLQELSAAPVCKLCFFSNVTPTIGLAVMCFLRIHLTPGTWQPPYPFAALHLQTQKWFWLVLF